MTTHLIEDDLIEETLAMNRSPRSLRSSSSSPRKKTPCPGRTPDADESSVDIYGDLSMDSIHIEPKNDAVKRQPVCMDTDMGKNMDLFTDFLISDLSEKEKLQRRIKVLEDQNQVLQKCKEQLSKNISSLFITAKSELQLKDQEINRLRKMIDDLQATATKQNSRSYPSKQTVKPKLFLHESSRGDKLERAGMSETSDLPSVRSKNRSGSSLQSMSSKSSTASSHSKRQYQRDKDQRQYNERDKSHVDNISDVIRHQRRESDRFPADSRHDSRNKHCAGERDRSRSPRCSETYTNPVADKVVEGNGTREELNSEQRDYSIRGESTLNCGKMTRENTDKYKDKDFRKEKDIVEAYQSGNETTEMQSHEKNSPQIFDVRSDLLQNKNSVKEKGIRERIEKAFGNAWKGEISKRDIINKDQDKQIRNDISSKSQKMEILERSHKQLMENFCNTQEVVENKDKRQSAKFDLEAGITDVLNCQKKSASCAQENWGDVNETESRNTPVVNFLASCELKKSERGKSSYEKGHIEEKESKSVLNREISISKKENPSQSDLSSTVNKSAAIEQTSEYDCNNSECEIEDIHDKKSNDNAGNLKTSKALKSGLSLNEGLELIGKNSSCGNIGPKQKIESKIMKKITDTKNVHSNLRHKKEDYLGNSSKPISLPPIMDPSTSQKIRTEQRNKFSLLSSFEEENSAGQCMEIESQKNGGEHNNERLSQENKSHHLELSDDPFSKSSHQAAFESAAAVDNVYQSISSDSQTFKASQYFQAKAQCSLEVGKNTTESQELISVKDLSRGSISDQSSDSEGALFISKDASVYEEKSVLSGFCHENSLETHIDASDCFAKYKESFDNSSQPTSLNIDPHANVQHTHQQRKESNSYSITSQSVTSTSASMSMSSNVSLPFSNLMDTKNSDFHQEKSSSQPLSPSNHTWPFKVGDVSHSPFHKKPESTLALSSSSSSSSLLPSDHLQKAHQELSQINQNKSSDIESVRAFPITNIQSDDTHSLLQPKLPKLIVSSVERNDVDTLDSNPASTESLSEKSSNSQEIEGCSVASAETNSRPVNDTDTNSFSTERQCAEKNHFQRLISEQNSVDYANLSPPKIWQRNIHATPSKPNMNPLFLSPQPDKSSSVMCTPNLIVLGDEETSSGTLVSPYKPNLTPSDFYPPGVRMNPQEVSTHRHIRGEPELLHAEEDRHFKQTQSPKMYEKDSTDSDIKAGRHGENVTSHGETSESTSNETIQTVTEGDESKDSGDVSKDISSEKGCALQEKNQEGDMVVKSESEKESSSFESQGSMLSVVQKVYEKIFMKDYSQFKAEMKEKADIDHLLLRTALTLSVQNILKWNSLMRFSKKIVSGSQDVQNSAEDTDHTDNVTSKKKCHPGGSQSEDKLLNESYSKVPSHDSETIDVNDLDKNSNNANVNDQEMEVNSVADFIQSSSLCFKCQSTACVCNNSKFEWYSGISVPSERINEGQKYSSICPQSRESQSQGALASSCKRNRKVCKFSFFTSNSTKSSDVSTSKKCGSERHTGSVVTCREESTQSSILSTSLASEDKLIHETVSSLDTNWQETIEKDFKEQVNSTQPLLSTVPEDLPEDVPMPNKPPPTKEISFAGRIPSILNDESKTDDEDNIFEIRKFIDMQTNSVPIGPRRKDSTDGHEDDKLRQNQKKSLKGGCCASPDICSVTSSDIHREDTATAGNSNSTARISPFGAEEPDSTCDPFPKRICIQNKDCHSWNKEREAVVTSVKIKPTAFQNLIHKLEVEDNRTDLPDSPQKDFRRRRDRNKKTSCTPKASRREMLNARGRGKMTLPLGSLISLNRRLFPNDESDEPSETLGKLQMDCEKTSDTKKVTSSKTNCIEYERGVSNEKSEDKGDLAETIGNSESDDHSTLEDNYKCLNITFTVHEHSSGDEEEAVTLPHKSCGKKLANSSGNSSPFGSPNYSPFVKMSKKFIPTPQQTWAMDELSLDAHSLSEFDQDVIKAKESIRLNRINSRTASFSSMLSVGHDSPMSVASHMVSTPTSESSPRNALLSPCEGRVLDSCDEGMSELDDEVVDHLGFVKGHQKHNERDECMKGFDRIEGKVSRHMAFSDLQRVMLVKNYTPSSTYSRALNRNKEILKPTDQRSDCMRKISSTGKRFSSEYEKAPDVHSSPGRSSRPSDKSVHEDYKQRQGDLLEKKKTECQGRSQNRKVLDGSRSAREKMSNGDSESSDYETTAKGHPLEFSNTEISTSLLESPNKTFKLRKNVRKQTEDLLSSEDEDVEGNVCFHNVEENTLKMSGRHSMANSKVSTSRKTVKIVEPSPIDLITIGSPFPSSNGENHFILKRLQLSPTKPQSKVSSPAYNNTSEELVSKLKETHIPTNASGSIQQPTSDCRRRERRNQSPLEKTSDIPEVDQEVLSWARAHQKNVDKVKLKLDTRLNDSKHSADDSDEQWIVERIEHQKISPNYVNETHVNDEYVFHAAQNCEEVSESKGREEEMEREGSCEEDEDGEIMDDSDCSGGSSKTSHFNCNEPSSVLITSADKSLPQQGCCGELEMQSANLGALDRCGDTNTDNAEPRRMSKDFVQKLARSDSEQRVSPLSGIYLKSSKIYGRGLDDVRSRKRPRSSSPEVSCSRSHEQRERERRENEDLRKKLSRLRKELSRLCSKEDTDWDGRRYRKRRRDSYKEEENESIKIREKVVPRKDRYGRRNSAECANPHHRSQRWGSPDNRHSAVHRRDRGSRSGSDLRRGEERHKERELHCRDCHKSKDRRNDPGGRRRLSVEFDHPRR